MEFKFRSKDDQPSTYRASFIYFTEQAIRGECSNNNVNRPHEFFRNPNDMREAIQRELEKERIREEIIAGEIARRRELEAEVRRELMMEKGMGFWRSDGFQYLSRRFEPPPHGLHRQPILHQQEGRSFEGRSGRRDTGGFEMVPLRRHSGPKIAEMKPVPEVYKVLPNTNITGVKRKAAETSELASVGSKKQPKEEWSCAICQVTATSEQGLNQHLEGKKHKSKEAAQKTGQNFGIGILPKKTPVLIKLVETNSRPSSVQIIKNKKSPSLKKKKKKKQSRMTKRKQRGHLTKRKKNP